MGTKLVAYCGKAVLLYSRALGNGERCLYAHLIDNNIKPVLTTHNGDVEVHLVYQDIKNTSIEKVMACLKRFNVEPYIHRVQPAWYDNYIATHLVEPVIKKLDKPPYENDYHALLRYEFWMIKTIAKIINHSRTKEINGVVFLPVRVSVLTMDVAVLLNGKLGVPVCVSSPRDVGLAFTCVGSPRLIHSLYRKLCDKGVKTLKPKPPSMLTGFIVSYPQAGYVMNEVLYEVLEEIPEPRRTYCSHKVFYEKILDGLCYKKFASLLARFYGAHVKKITYRGREYMLIEPGHTPFYSVMVESNNIMGYEVFLPPNKPLAVRFPFKPAEVYVNDHLVPEKSIEKTINGTLVFIRDPHIQGKIKQTIASTGTATILGVS